MRNYRQPTFHYYWWGSNAGRAFCSVVVVEAGEDEDGDAPVAHIYLEDKPLLARLGLVYLGAAFVDRVPAILLPVNPALGLAETALRGFVHSDRLTALLRATADAINSDTFAPGPVPQAIVRNLPP